MPYWQSMMALRQPNQQEAFMLPLQHIKPFDLLMDTRNNTLTGELGRTTAPVIPAEFC